MAIEAGAPVTARASIDVAASPERIWELMTGFADWPSWNPDIKWAEIDGDLVPGTGFRWKAGPGVIRSRLTRVEAPSHLEWTGKTMGIRAAHVWRIEPAGGGAKVVTEESWNGLLPRLFSGFSRRTLEDSLRDGLEALKAAAEKG
jgi:hypothetical protein